MRLGAQEDPGDACDLGLHAGLSVRALHLVADEMLGDGTLLKS